MDLVVANDDILAEGLSQIQVDVDETFDALLPVPEDTRAR
jgi:hypothetical protein